MLTRTWPYGTKKRVLVLDNDTGTLICTDSAGEGYIIVGGYADEHTAKPGDKGTITFTAGGPTGGHWVYTANDRRLRSVVGLTCAQCAHHYYSGKTSKCEMWVELEGGPTKPLRPPTAPTCDWFRQYKPEKPNRKAPRTGGDGAPPSIPS